MSKIAPIDSLPQPQMGDPEVAGLMETPRPREWRREWPRMLCSVHLLAAIGAIAAWLLILTLVDVLTSSSTWLHEPAIAAPSLVLVFLAFEARLLLRGARASSNPRVEMAISLLVLHAAAIWYAVLRLALAQPDRRGLEALHAALLYAMLLALVYLRWRLGGGLPERLAELEVELSEARVQYDAVCALLQRRSHLDAEDEVRPPSLPCPPLASPPLSSHLPFRLP